MADKQSPMVDVSGDTFDDIRAWLDRHGQDDDPPKVACAYLKKALDEIDRLTGRGDDIGT